MDGWMDDKRMYGWIDGWMGGGMDGEVDGGVDGCTGTGWKRNETYQT